MNTATTARSLAVLAVAALVAACSGQGMTPFTKIDGSDPALLGKMDGSWTIINTGGTKVEGMNPPAVVVFGTRSKAVTGFDGCNDFKGTYAFDQGLLKAKVASTRRACTSDMARTISARLGDLLTQGAEVVETSFMKGHVLMLKNAGGDLRMGPTEALRKP